MSRRRPRASSIVGVVLDGDVIRGTHIRERFGRRSILGCVEVEVDPEITDHGRIVDYPAFSAALRDLWKAGRFRTRHMAFGIDGRDATFRRLALPTALLDAASADGVGDAARYELATYLPYPIDEAITTVQEVDRTDETVDVVVVAVRRTTAEELADAVGAAGLRLRDLTLAPTALGVSAAGAGEDDTVVSVDGASTTIVVRRHARATVVRVLTGGGGDRAVQAADELEEALASVDQFRLGGVARAEPVADPRQRRFRAVAEEVAAAIRFEESQAGGEAVPKRVDLTGAYGDDETLVGLVASEVDATVSIVEPPEWWPPQHSFATYAVAAGVGLGAFDRDPGVVHIDVPSLTLRRRTRQEVALGAAAAALLLVPIVQLIGAARDHAEEAEERAVAAEVEADLLAAEAESFEEIAALREAVTMAREVRADAVAGEIWMQRVLGEVAEAMPDETFLTGLTLRRPLEEDAVEQGDATATFSGIALDQAGAAEWLIAVESLDLIDDVWLVQSTASVFGELELPVVAFVGEGELTPASATPRSLGIEEVTP